MDRIYIERGTLLSCWWEHKLVQPLCRAVWMFLKKTKIELPYDPAIPLLDINLKKTLLWRVTCIPTFIAPLFTAAKTWKLSKCSSAEEWIKTHTQSRILFSHKNHMDEPRHNILRQKQISYDAIFMWNPKK